MKASRMVTKRSLRRAAITSSVATGALALAISFPLTAGAQTFVTGSEEVEGTVVERPETPSNPGGGEEVAPGGDEVLDNTLTNDEVAGDEAEVLGEVVDSEGLALTGTDIAGLAGLGAVTIGAGAMALVARRRTSVSE